MGHACALSGGARLAPAPSSLPLPLPAAIMQGGPQEAVAILIELGFDEH
ncbi:MAG TPA: hypothetical protein VGJ20_33315 [Xanthobacteraceae bacterium]